MLKGETLVLSPKSLLLGAKFSVIIITNSNQESKKLTIFMGNHKNNKGKVNYSNKI